MLDHRKDAINRNVSRLMAEYYEDGMIGRSRPTNERQAKQMAFAIASELDRQTKKRKAGRHGK